MSGASGDALKRQGGRADQGNPQVRPAVVQRPAMDCKGQFHTGRARAEHHQFEALALPRDAIDQTRPRCHEALDGADGQRMVESAWKMAQCRLRAGVDGEQVERQRRPVGAGDGVRGQVQAGAGRQRDVDASALRQRIERDRALVDRIAALDPARHHAGIDLAPERRHQAHLPAIEWMLGQVLQHGEMRVATAQQYQALHGLAAKRRSLNQVSTLSDVLSVSAPMPTPLMCGTGPSKASAQSRPTSRA